MKLASGVTQPDREMGVNEKRKHSQGLTSSGIRVEPSRMGEDGNSSKLNEIANQGRYRKSTEFLQFCE